MVLWGEWALCTGLPAYPKQIFNSTLGACMIHACLCPPPTQYFHTLPSHLHIHICTLLRLTITNRVTTDCDRLCQSEDQTSSLQCPCWAVGSTESLVNWKSPWTQTAMLAARPCQGAGRASTRESRRVPSSARQRQMLRPRRCQTKIGAQRMMAAVLE